MSATQPRPLKSGEFGANDWQRINDHGATAADARNHASQLHYREARPRDAIPEFLHPFKIYQPPWELVDGVDWSTFWRTFRIRAGRVMESDATGTDAATDSVPNGDPDALYYPSGTVDIRVPAATAIFWFWLEISVDGGGNTSAVVRYGIDPTADHYTPGGGDPTPGWTSTNPWAAVPISDDAHVPIGTVDTNTHANELRAAVRQLLRSDWIRNTGLYPL